ncbi:hypothetical protein [Stella sp.]|uniref:hypothetical protein n=1 Tax=Stella sp. TaxID=2912054 RepID=UPI0035B4939E
MRTDPFAIAWARQGEPVCNLARMMWEDDGRPEGAEAEYVRRARIELEAERPAPGYREAGTSGLQGTVAGSTGLPPDPTELGRPMRDDEKVDEAVLESMDACDPPAFSGPAFSGTGSGAPDRRRTRR